MVSGRNPSVTKGALNATARGGEPTHSNFGVVAPRRVAQTAMGLSRALLFLAY